MSLRDLEAMTDQILLEGNPRLRNAIRGALDAGIGLDQVRQRWGLDGKCVNLIACAVDAIVAEWEREVDAIAADLRKGKP